MCEPGKPCEFPAWAQPVLGKKWRPATKEEWFAALSAANGKSGK